MALHELILSIICMVAVIINGIHGKLNEKFIVHLKEDHSHSMFEQSIFRHPLYKNLSSSGSVTHKYHHVLHGLAVEGIPRELLAKLDGVVRIVPDTLKHIITLKSWGLDRIDQQSLPLNDIYSPAFTGAGVDVYVVDTGIDTNHIEFTTGSSKRAINIYSAYVPVASKYNPGINTDGQGHGTHVSGTVGGNTVGVSPGVTLYGLKVLSNDGSGDTSTILDALDYVYVKVQASHKRSIVTMSLGGPCDTSDCSQDSIVQAVEYLTAHNIVVSVAAGNEGCNACAGSPNAAPSAVNVGASDQQDRVAYFSNFGQCVDVFAPGVDITSACTSVRCQNSRTSYLTMSGTSMACPHTTGVIAQLLQKWPSASVTDIHKALSCDAARNILSVDSRDTISRNLLLNVPLNNGDNQYSSCALGAGCDSSCSDQGVCLPVYASSSAVDKSTFCHCDDGTYGSACALDSDPVCSSPTGTTVDISLTDTKGDGWTYAKFALIDSKGLVIDNAFDALCYGDIDSRQYCVEPGCFKLVVSSGSYPTEVGWSMCGMSGGAPYTGEFCVNGDGVCGQTCHNGTSNEAMTLHDSFGDGWSGAYYVIFAESGEQLYSGTLSSGGQTIHSLCLPTNTCSFLMFLADGTHPEEVSVNICGFTANTRSVVKICMDAQGTCSAVTDAADDTCHDNYVPFYMFDTGANGWEGSQYSLVSTQTGQAVARGNTLVDGFEQMDGLCLRDGCYDLKATGGGPLAHTQESFWYACNTRGTIPWSSKLCVIQKYGLCYGLSGCPFIKSFAHTSDIQYYFISHYDTSYGMDLIDDIQKLHGVHDMCDLVDGCYQAMIGAGKVLGSGDRGTFELCGYSGPMPAIAKFCVTNHTQSCHVTSVQQAVCAGANKVPQYMAKLDTQGDGWGRLAKYSIKSGTTEVAFGTLATGQYGVDMICLQQNTCYTLSVIAKNYADEILWVMCGFVGGAPVTAMRFCITGTGACEFTSANDDTYTNLMDDDFPAPPAPTMEPVASPSKAPVIVLTASPTVAPSTSEPTFSPTVLQIEPSNRPTAHPTSAPSPSPTSAPSPSPTSSPSPAPSSSLTPVPTVAQSDVPTTTPTAVDTQATSASDMPSVDPTRRPTAVTTVSPTRVPPTRLPSQLPTVPTPVPSPTSKSVPSVLPTLVTLLVPSAVPTLAVAPSGNSRRLLTVDLNVTMQVRLRDQYSAYLLTASDTLFLQYAVRHVLLAASEDVWEVSASQTSTYVSAFQRSQKKFLVDHATRNDVLAVTRPLDHSVRATEMTSFHAKTTRVHESTHSARVLAVLQDQKQGGQAIYGYTVQMKCLVHVTTRLASVSSDTTIAKTQISQDIQNAFSSGELQGDVNYLVSFLKNATHTVNGTNIIEAVVNTIRVNPTMVTSFTSSAQAPPSGYLNITWSAENNTPDNSGGGGSSAGGGGATQLSHFAVIVVSVVVVLVALAWTYVIVKMVRKHRAKNQFSQYDSLDNGATATSHGMLDNSNSPGGHKDNDNDNESSPEVEAGGYSHSSNYSLQRPTSLLQSLRGSKMFNYLARNTNSNNSNNKGKSQRLSPGSRTGGNSLDGADTVTLIFNPVGINTRGSLSVMQPVKLQQSDNLDDDNL